MKFKTGNKNGKGRPQGAPNKIPTSLRDSVYKLIVDHWEDVEKDLKTVKGKNRLEIICKLLVFCLPRLESISIQEIPDLITLMSMTKEQRTEYLLSLKNGLKD